MAAHNMQKYVPSRPYCDIALAECFAFFIFRQQNLKLEIYFFFLLVAFIKNSIRCLEADGRDELAFADLHTNDQMAVYPGFDLAVIQRISK